ncbi:MAG: SGNH/GDSL hydrolase family protein [Lachnospiraceae bacterium]|nr:SGNH/GDSL hydrolase family protein [Lachnospiraceae bacterium]
MKLTNEQLRSIYFGVLHFGETEDGYLQSFQYTKEQMAYFERVSEFWYERCFAGSAKTLEFTTEATQLSFDYKMIWAGSEDSVEMAVDGLVSQIYYVKDIAKEGRLTFELPEGKKDVIIYLPADATVWIRNFEIDGEFVPAKKGEKVLWMGDSITQGYGPLRSAHTYVSVANRLLNYDILNQGIGGYVYDKNVLTKMEGYQPDKIIISMGTNQFGSPTMQDVEEYYVRLKEVYGDTPVLCILPIWRGDVPGGEPTLVKFCRNIKAICEKYSNITVVDGFQLVPHLSEYFLDDLHPNALGGEIYGRNLVLEIQKLGF